MTGDSAKSGDIKELANRNIILTGGETRQQKNKIVKSRG